MLRHFIILFLSLVSIHKIIATDEGKNALLTEARIAQIGNSTTFRATLDPLTGFLTPLSIPHLLTESGLTKEILETKELKIVQVEGGTYSGAIFKVTVPQKYLIEATADQIFIIKNVTWAYEGGGQKKYQSPQKEFQNFERIRKSKLMAMITSGQNPHLPDLKIDLKSYFYIDGPILYVDKNTKKPLNRPTQKQFVSILPLARGVNIYDLVEFDGWDTSDIRTAMSRVGRAIGEIHYQMSPATAQQKMLTGDFNFEDFKTVIHGDFNWNNIFYDKTSGKVSLIDNATLGDSLTDPQPFWHEFYLFYIFPKFGWMVDNSRGISWLNPLFEAFVNGYVQAYPTEVRERLAVFILNKMKFWSRQTAGYVNAEPYKEIPDSDWVYDYDPRNYVYQQLTTRKPPQIQRNIAEDPWGKEATPVLPQKEHKDSASSQAPDFPARYCTTECTEEKCGKLLGRAAQCKKCSGSFQRPMVEACRKAAEIAGLL